MIDDAPAGDATPKLPYFDALDPSARADALAAGERRDAPAGRTLFLQDEPCAGLFIVRSGLVKIFKLSPDGREQVLRHVGPGDSFNEVPAFDGGPNAAGAAVLEDAELLVWTRDAVLGLLDRHPDFARDVIAALAARMRHLVELVEDLSFRHVSERVARILLQSVAPHGGVGAGAAARRRPTQREIAEMAGTSREVVARALKALEAAGAIRIERGEIRLLNPDRLSDLT